MNFSCYIKKTRNIKHHKDMVTHQTIKVAKQILRSTIAITRQLLCQMVSKCIEQKLIICLKQLK